ncbi:MOSC domain-containing protein [Alkalibacillus aidingensis]|uniref:MOSC domain-containing protein n=1 Tax=Alkalibacillus aidingensis TaxID=2747607 RepID=UPI0016606671|nr:MOSC domain-containing protein [Alkalibacillus aidingensis]
MSAPYIKELLVGRVKKIGDSEASIQRERQWESGMFKEGTNDQLWLSRTGLASDEVADKKNHGGPEKAIFAYSTCHYDYWKEDLGLEKIGIGAMGENLAVQSMDEHSVCIGDRYQFGDSVIQVSQPRKPCWKPARRFNINDFALRIQQTGRTGWYFRVLEEGYVQSEVELSLLERPYPQWTIAKCNEIMYEKKDDIKLNKKLYSCELLADKWKQSLAKRLT